jgi:hypothetical protein
MLDDVSPLESSCDATVVEAIASSAVAMAEGKASRLRAQLEAVQEATARSEQEAAHAMACHVEA